MKLRLSSFCFFLLSCIFLQGKLEAVLEDDSKNRTYIDLNKRITKVATTQFYDIYVGGENFLAWLTSDLQLVYSLALGPVQSDRDCYPRKAPCSNTVNVLEIDKKSHSLLVCGTAYNGTCTLHDLSDIMSWKCVWGDSSYPGSGMIASPRDHTTLIHFLKDTSMEYPGNQGLQPNNDGFVSCRSGDFAMLEFSANSDHGGNVPTRRLLMSESERFSMDPTQILMPSYLFVASFRKDLTSKGSYPLLSVREMQDTEGYDILSFPKTDTSNTPGIYVKPELGDSFDVELKLSFFHDQYSYVVMSQKTPAGDVAKIIRMEHTTAALTPLVEVVMDCTHKSVKYTKLVSAALGNIGFKSKDATKQFAVLLLAFEYGSRPTTVNDPRMGSVICGYTIANLDKSSFDFAKLLCDQIGGSVPSWIQGTPTKCSKHNANYFSHKSSGTNSKAFHFLPSQKVTSMLTHTQTVMGSEKREELASSANVYFVTDKGIISRFSFGILFDNNLLRLNAVKEPNFVADLGPVPSDDNPPTGMVDNTNAVMFLAYGSKMTKLWLDPCRKYSTCSSCIEESTEKCRWCASQFACIIHETAVLVCANAAEGRCPPLITAINPTEVPVSGGTRVTLTGTKLGDPGQGEVKVTVCGEPCDDVMPASTSLTCTVGPQCPTCPSTCNVNLKVSGQKNSMGNTNSSVNNQFLEYVRPNLTSFYPRGGYVRGNIVITLKGSYLNVGTVKTATVAGVACSLSHYFQNRQEYTCRLNAANASHENTCGDVIMTFDNYTANATDGQYCFWPTPLIEGIHPLSTIRSGGTNITLTGSHLGSVKNLRFAVKVKQEETWVIEEFLAKCQPVDSQGKITCLSPDLTSADLYDWINNRFVAVNFSMTVDGANIKSDVLQELYVFKDPLFSNLEDTTNKIYPKTAALFQIWGQHIPTWIPKSNFEVTLEGIPCHMVEVFENRITCNVRDVIRNYRKRIRTRTTTTKPTPTKSTTTSQRTTANTNNSTSDPISMTTNAFAANITTGPTLPSSASKTMTAQNVTSSGANTTLPQFKNPFSKDNNRRPVFLYDLKVRVGGYVRDLGPVSVGPKPAPETQKMKEENGVAKLILPIAVSVGALLLVGMVVAAVCVCVRRRRKHNQPFYLSHLEPPSSGETAIPTLAELLESVLDPSKKEQMSRLIIDKERLDLGKSIGAGNFGCVYEGVLTRPEDEVKAKVAVKTLQEKASQALDLSGFVKEAVIMLDFDHNNVLGLIGLTENETGIPYVILPYMDNGDLLTYIRETSTKVSLLDVVGYAADISSGMVYLSSLMFIHRDLAARNCMLDASNTVKVADFGLCRDIYEKGYYTSDNKKKLPIRWMALESIQQGAYSTKSDVWSMGVVIWELLTRGVTPYPGVDGWDIHNFLKKRRLDPPFFCPDSLYKMMMTCWAKDPDQRPPFKDLEQQLYSMLGRIPPSTPVPLKRSNMGKSKTTLRSEPSTPDPEKTMEFNNNPSVKYVNYSETNRPLNNSNIANKIPELEKDNAQPTDEDEAPHSPHYTNVVCSKTNTNFPLDPNIGDSTNKEKVSPPYVETTGCMTVHKSKIVKNVQLTIPQCYSSRRVRREESVEYIQLIDNYEAAPKFLNQFSRSKRKTKRSSQKHGGNDIRPKIRQEIPASIGPDNRSSLGYSTPVIAEAVQVRTNEMRDSDVPSIVVEFSPYYELEGGVQRGSNYSDHSSSRCKSQRSSVNTHDRTLTDLSRASFASLASSYAIDEESYMDESISSGLPATASLEKLPSHVTSGQTASSQFGSATISLKSIGEEMTQF